MSNILLIDNYDSFTYNVSQSLTSMKAGVNRPPAKVKAQSFSILFSSRIPPIPYPLPPIP